MTTFKCPECGKIHDLSQAALVFRMPRHVAELRREIGKEEFAARVQMNDDLCCIDEKLYFIRGVLEVPVKELDATFEWGLWALVDQVDFNHYVELWDADIDEHEPPFTGWLSGSPPEYPESDMAEVVIHMRSNGMRPMFMISASDQPLGIAQREGITPAEVHQFIAKVG
ncbi:MAG TPA: DUF2199 domain-containing protein [Aggregatilineales bacterium]|nr:DUF2199 domain-containing protein [Aggregatilineales bacterium]